MDGREKARLQEEKGLRSIVEDIDSLRISYGHSAVQVLTPIVETKLRSAMNAARSLKVSVDTLIGSNTFKFCFTYPEGFPKLPVEATVVVNDNHDEKYHSLVESTARLMNEDGNYMVGVSIIRNFILETDPKTTELRGDNSEFNEDENLEKEVGSETVFRQIQPTSESSSKYYTCKICRNHLFEHMELHEHSAREEQTCFSLFLEEPYKGLDHTGLIEGKLSCRFAILGITALSLCRLIIILTIIVLINGIIIVIILAIFIVIAIAIVIVIVIAITIAITIF